MNDCFVNKSKCIKKLSYEAIGVEITVGKSWKFNDHVTETESNKEKVISKATDWTSEYVNK